MSESLLLSFLASKSIAMHLSRGGAAVAFIAVAVQVSDTWPILSVGAGIAALVMLRGCPMCWTIGFIQTVRNRLTLRLNH